VDADRAAADLRAVPVDSPPGASRILSKLTLTNRVQAAILAHHAGLA
jgi:hypothetical protein